MTTALHPSTLRAIKAAALDAADEYQVVAEPGDVTLRTYYVIPEGDDMFPPGKRLLMELRAIQIEDGRWVRAYWSERHCQWQSGDVSPAVAAASPQIAYAFARSIEALARDLRKYRSCTDALRAGLQEGRDERPRRA